MSDTDPDWVTVAQEVESLAPGKCRVIEMGCSIQKQVGVSHAKLNSDNVGHLCSVHNVPPFLHRVFPLYSHPLVRETAVLGRSDRFTEKKFNYSSIAVNLSPS